ncbi:uncharacterized protein EAF02_011681 [Botrytis sinoallii]|uniref:uncharacterized protein n=1 Tax=Botrytis sinoallii TaxID=1463999 RepID=UPI001902B2DB|nr:uncharacterized protein EAF02_011681 [Botrytis sinoallii]KAF7854506.1 hypothetical protein EAF02_011681 [Botrytis sinoallii]
MNSFTATRHKTLTPATTPANNSLPSPFVVCVIGASSGIGEHIAYSFAQAGASGIILASRNNSELTRVAEKIRVISPKTRVEMFSCDITLSSNISDLAHYIKETFGRLDVCIPNSGYAGPVTLKVTEGDPSWFQGNFDINMIGTYHCAHYLIPLLLESENGAKGFIQIGSLAATLTGGPIANTGYCVSKFAQSRFLEMVGSQFGEEGLVAVTVHPGAVATPMAAGNTPEVFLPYLVDSVDLCGGFCVWLSKNIKDLKWMNGRFLDARWDIDELLKRKQNVVEKDLLKWTLRTS